MNLQTVIVACYVYTATRYSRHGTQTPMPGLCITGKAMFGTRDWMGRGKLVSRDADLSSEGNVSRRCARADGAWSSRVCKARLLGSQKSSSSTAVARGCHTLRASPRKDSHRPSTGRQVCVDTPCLACHSSRPPSPCRPARQSKLRLQTCLRSDRCARLALHVGSSSARTRSCCCCCTRAREQEARPPARTLLSAPRRRGGAELSGKVRCHGEGCTSNIEARCVNTTVPKVPFGCQALSGHSGRLSGRVLDHQRHC
jgi:hypothetical protein